LLIFFNRTDNVTKKTQRHEEFIEKSLSEACDDAGTVGAGNYTLAQTPEGDKRFKPLCRWNRNVKMVFVI